MPTNGVDQPEPEHPIPSEREHTNLRLTKLEVDVAHAVSEASLEKSIGDMKTGIASAIGDMKVGVAEAVGEMKREVTAAEKGIKLWVIGILITAFLTLITTGITLYKFFSSVPSSN